MIRNEASFTRIVLAVAMLLLVLAPTAWCFLSTSSNNNGRSATTISPSLSVVALYNNIPRVIVFDLDNTLWTPELYQLRRLQRQNLTPVAGKDVKLFDGAIKVLEDIIPSLTHPETGAPPVLAIASRTQSVAWAEDLIDQFDLRRRFHAIEIFPSHKTKHFSNIQQATRVPLEEMMFFDDARDGKYGNCVPVSAMASFVCIVPWALSPKIFSVERWSITKHGTRRPIQ